MNTLRNSLLNVVDRSVTRLGPLNKLVDAMVSRIAPTAIAAASCGQASIFCYSYCGDGCWIIKVYKGYEAGSCSCEERTGKHCLPCSMSY